MVAFTAGSHSLVRYSRTLALVGARVALLLDRDEQLVHRRLALLLRGEAGLDGAAALLGLLQSSAALGAARVGAALDPEALLAGRAALRRMHAHVDDVLPGAKALLAAVTHVASHSRAPSRLRRQLAAATGPERRLNKALTARPGSLMEASCSSVPVPRNVTVSTYTACPASASSMTRLIAATRALTLRT